jgi:hypothetical protein
MLWILLLLISCLPALKALILPGFYNSQDGPFHLIRLMHFFEEIGRGQFPVRISQDLAHGFGYPVYTFFYPGAYYLGSFFHFFSFDFSTSLKLVLGLAVVLSIIFTYLWLRCHFSPLPSFLGAFLYLYVPYRFSSLYVTAAVGIVLAMMFTPLILYSLNRLITRSHPRFILLFAFSSASLVLSHNVSAIIFLPLIILYTSFLLATSSHLKLHLTHLVLGLVFALTLSAFFLFPLVRELDYVNLGRSVVVNYYDHFPTLRQLLYSPWGYGYSQTGPVDGMSFSFGLAQWAVLVFSFIKLIRCRSLLPGLIFVFTLLTIFLMLSSSDFLWQIIPLIKQVQFPWRLLMSTSLTTAFLGAWLVSGNHPVRYPIFLFLLLLAFVGNRHHLNPSEPWRYPDSYFQSNDILYHGSTDIAWEARPKWVDFIPQYKPVNFIAIPSGVAAIPLIPVYPERSRYQVTLPVITDISFNLFYYPTWQIAAAATPAVLKPITTHPSFHGLITFTLPAGTSYFSLTYRRSPLEIVSDDISLSAWVLLVILTGAAASAPAASAASAARSSRSASRRSVT